MRPEAVSTLIGEALAQLEPQLSATEVELEVDLPAEVIGVTADRAAIVEALLNLLSNAVKYGGSGGKVSVHAQQKKGRVQIDISDNGPGIPLREQRQIFERFYRGRAHEDGSTVGSGLGLAMAHLIVKAHRGKILVDSKPGEGACFTITLPALSSPTAVLEVPPG
jgi:two-component system phosphate regulon sensor histidine kinase PhoR